MKLTPLQYEVTQNGCTENAFENEYWDHKEEGIYVDIVNGEALFCSIHKFDSGTGWPSFTKPIMNENIGTKEDHKFGMKRTEVHSKKAKSHLGHVFPDGPGPSGLRYCINSASLKFIPKNKMKELGYEKFLGLFENKTEKATLAGGCFWGVEELFRTLIGVLKTEVGYTGGLQKNPIYETVKTGQTGHAESIDIEFDPEKISYEELLIFFFKIHDPTTLNQQGNDRGSQYRSEIFYHSEKQKEIALRVIQKIEKMKRWKNPIVTRISKADHFYPAESYHQDYLQKNPGGYTCHYIRD